jgi:hypothetical protein
MSDPTSYETKHAIEVIQRLPLEERQRLTIAFLQEGLSSWHTTMLCALVTAIVDELSNRTVARAAARHTHACRFSIEGTGAPCPECDPVEPRGSTRYMHDVREACPKCSAQPGSACVGVERGLVHLERRIVGLVRLQPDRLPAVLEALRRRDDE